MENREVPDDSVEGGVFEWKRLGIRLPEVDPGIQLPSKLDHGRGDVNADDVCSPLGRHAGDVAGTGSDVEHTRSGLDGGGVEERLGEAARERAEGAVVPLCCPLPAGGLECIEGIRVDARVLHAGERSHRGRSGQEPGLHDVCFTWATRAEACPANPSALDRPPLNHDHRARAGTAAPRSRPCRYGLEARCRSREARRAPPASCPRRAVRAPRP